MAEQSLAVKYRPKTFEDVTEQGSIIQILRNQLENGKIKHVYLFSGGAGTGKTTCARIFANEINNGKGMPVEIDAASNNSVESVRTVIQQAVQPSLDGSTYRVYIYDECHMLSVSAWNAMLKMLEEPPQTAIFIFCTTDPQKIPKTILSRTERYDFQRISQQGIVDRLKWIIVEENQGKEIDDLLHFSYDALEYIAKIADGGMRDAITLLEKCLAFDKDVSLDNVVKTVGTVDFKVFFDLTESIVDEIPKEMLEIIEQVHSQGKDLKLFVRGYLDFVLDLCKFDTMRTLTYTKIPNFYEDGLKKMDNHYFDICFQLLQKLLKLNSDVKWDSNPKALIEANLIDMCMRAE
jgi:DNA polymerase-3 subunit gamma/tau